MAARQEKDGYVLGRDKHATSRLNYQYYLWQNTLGFNLHPDIPKLAADARIADVATGSAIWLYDVSRQVPDTTKLTGLDISLDQIPVPNRAKLSNATFQQWNFFDPPPEEFRGVFDVVHVRLIAVVVKDNDPSKILSNIRLLLKPGGFFQWEEHYTPESAVISASGESTTEFEGLTQMRDLLSNSLHTADGKLLLGSRDWLKTAVKTLESVGFENVRRTIYQDVALMGTFWNELYSASAEESAIQLQAIDPSITERLDEIVDKVDQESQSGAWVSNPKVVFLAQRDTATQ